MDTPLSLHDFQQAIASFPEALRLIYQEGKIISSPSQEDATGKENSTILSYFKKALLAAFGVIITDFALPPSVAALQEQEKAPLSAPFLKKTLRKAINLKESLEHHHALFPLPAIPSAEECQAYLNALATYSKQEAETVAQEVRDKETATVVTITLTDDLMTSLFLATPAPALEELGNYITAHPAAIPTAVAAALGTEPSPISIGAFGLTSLIMHSSSHGAAAVAISKELEKSAQ